MGYKYSPWGREELDTTERLHTHTHTHTHARACAHAHTHKSFCMEIGSRNENSLAHSTKKIKTKILNGSLFFKEMKVDTVKCKT